MQQILPAITLEVSVLLLGVLMLFAEAFSNRADRSHTARYAIGVLLAVLGFSFFTKAAPGDVLWVDFGHTVGAEQRGRRPAVVVGSASHVRNARDLLIVVPCTSRFRGWRSHQIGRAHV